MGIVSLQPYAPGLITGDPIAIQSGTGLSLPGVESILEYNGAYLNIRDSLDTIMVTQIDGLSDADVRDAREDNPAQHGETYFDAFYSGRTIVLTGKIRAHRLAKLRDLQQGLRQIFADLSQELPLIFHAGRYESDVFINCKKSQPIVWAEAQTDLRYMRDFQITLRASNPRFLSLQPVSFQLGINMQASIENHGNFPAQPIITLDGGPITTPTIRNETTGDQIIFSGNVAASERITIDIANHRLVDANGVNVFKRLSIASDWLEIVPGQNVISVSSPNPSNASATFTYRHTYM